MEFGYQIPLFRFAYISSFDWTLSARQFRIFCPNWLIYCCYRFNQSQQIFCARGPLASRRGLEGGEKDVNVSASKVGADDVAHIHIINYVIEMFIAYVQLVIV